MMFRIVFFTVVFYFCSFLQPAAFQPLVMEVPVNSSRNDPDSERAAATASKCGGRVCEENEICKSTSENKKEECICKDGFDRGETSNKCEPKSKQLMNTTDLAQRDAIPFRIDGPLIVHLPEDSVYLSIHLEDTSDASNYTYYWELLDGGGFGSADTYTKPNLTLTGLKEGVIRLRATVSDEHSHTYHDHSLQVLSEKKPNKPPVVVIRPESPVLATEGSRIILDAEGSSDEDDSHLEFEWKLLNGPVVQLPAMNAAILRLDNLVVGNYSFGLTVRDREGATSSGTVEVIVSTKRDDPPKAQITKCGENMSRSTIDVRLPTNDLLLCANASSDDFGITSYKWFRIDNLITQLAVDYAGSSTPVLTLTNLQPNEKYGPYEFRLDVIDGSGQKDSATVSILVNKAVNHPPKPNAGGNQTVQLPVTSIVLDGNVNDDGEIVKYEWTQISGPSQVVIVNGDKSKCTVSSLEEGVYRFRLNVTDDGGLSGVDETFVSVVRSKNEPPVARAHNVTVYLPSNLAILNGSESSDDAGIVRYKWTAHDDVPSSIVFLGDSSEEPIAMIGGLLPGMFYFDLTVFDHSDAQNSITVSLNVIAGENELNSVELYLAEETINGVMPYRLRNKFEGRLATVLAVQIPEAMNVNVHFSEFAHDPTTGRLRIVFYANFSNSTQSGVSSDTADKNVRSVPTNVVSAIRAVKILRNEENMINDFNIYSINTLYCMLDCSGHGRCSNYSKQCECDRYWMPNLFNYWLKASKLDCSWSVVYFGICVFTVSLLFTIFVRVHFNRRSELQLSNWNMSKHGALSRRKKRRRFRRNDDESHTDGTLNAPSKLKDKNGSYSLLMTSDSISSESECEFAVRNGNKRGSPNEPDDEVELRERTNLPNLN